MEYYRELVAIYRRFKLLRMLEKWDGEARAAMKHGDYLYADYAHERAQEIQALLNDKEG